jgi:1-deoxy-D-xylulose-5-phosphate synthase
VLRDGDDLLIVAYGAMNSKALATADLLASCGVQSTVVNARFLRPLDDELLHPLARRIGKVVTIEEGTLAGGFGSALTESLLDADIKPSILRLGIPDVLVDHATPQQSFEKLGLTPAQMAESIQGFLQRSKLTTATSVVQQPSVSVLES